MSNGVPLIGEKQQIPITVSQLCVKCFPEIKPGIFIKDGNSICGEHMGETIGQEKEKIDGGD